MSLTSQLRDPKSPVSTWFAAHIKPEAAQRFVDAQNRVLAQHRPMVVEGADPALVGTAFDYAFRWERMPLYSFDVQATKGAKMINQRDMVIEAIDRGGWQPLLRPQLSIVLAWYEQVYRSGKTPEPLKACENIDQLLQAVRDVDAQDVEMLTRTSVEDFSTITGEWTPNPMFAGSDDVGGADADWIIGDTLYECKTSRKARPFEIAHLQQMVGYVLLDYPDAYKIRNVAWYFPRQRVLLAYPLDKVIADVTSKRANFKAHLAVHRIETQQKHGQPAHRVQRQRSCLPALDRELDDILWKHHGDEMDWDGPDY